MTNKLYGVVCATITPMKSTGEVDLESAGNLYRYLRQSGIHCLYPNGTNGESLSLSEHERRALAQKAQEAIGGDMPLYIQCGASTVCESYRHVRHAKEIGASGVGLMTPVFFPVDEIAMERYFAGILKEMQDFPIYLYNIPQCTGNDISPALLGKLMDSHANLQGIKFSRPDLLRLKAYIESPASRKADVLIGCDPLALCCMASGGKGWVSGPGAVFTRDFTRLYQEFSQGNLSAAQKTQAKITYVLNEMSGIPEIPAIKYMLTKMGVIRCEAVRRPLRSLEEDEKRKLDRLLKDCL